MSDSPSYIAKLNAGLEAAGVSKDGITAVDLAPADQFHVGGIESVQRLIAEAGFSAEDHVLDMGCGLGGPARVLSNTVGCRVTGYDLHPESVEAGNILSQWTSQDDRVTLRVADATAIPEEDDSFDAAWTVHVGMFVEDKARFYGEAARLLKRGGKFVVFDPMLTGNDYHSYPVPWAQTPETNYIGTLDMMRGHLEDAGFRIEKTVDRTAESKAWFRDALAAIQANGGPLPLGMHLLLGPEFGPMSQNAAMATMQDILCISEVHAVKL